jgi:hypothetical protein
MTYDFAYVGIYFASILFGCSLDSILIDVPSSSWNHTLQTQPSGYFEVDRMMGFPSIREKIDGPGVGSINRVRAAAIQDLSSIRPVIDMIELHNSPRNQRNTNWS